LVGDNALATALAEADWMRGVTVERSPSLDVQGTVETQVIVFTETAGEKLSAQLLSCVDRDHVVIVAPVTDWHFSKKPLFLVSIPKAGTHLLYELAKALGYQEGIELPEFPKGQTWYCVEYSNSHTVAADFFVDTVRRAPFGNRHHPFMRSPTLFIYRHPLDILVSEAHYYHCDGKTAFAGRLSEYDLKERLTRLLDDSWLMGSLRDRIGGFLPWLEFPNVISLSFEELVGAAGGGSEEAQLQLIWSIQLKLQVPGEPEHIATKVFNTDSATFRSGQIGGYRKHLPVKSMTDFAKNNTDILEQLGYPLDGTIGLPTQRKARRHRRIRYSQIDYERMPLTIERDFLGCNLVRYGGRIYAVPMAAGPVGIDTFSSHTLAALPFGASLSELKALLLIGHSQLGQHKQALEQLADVLKKDNVPGCAVHYWKDTPSSCVVDVYNGFNVVAYRERYFGIRQSIGPIDLSGCLTDLVQRYEPGDLLVSWSIAELHADIDGLSTPMRIRQEAATADARVLAAMRALEVKQAGLEEQLLAERRAATQEIDRVCQEAAMANERALAAMRTLEGKQAGLEEQLLAERRVATQEIERVRQEAVTADERTLAVIRVLEEKQAGLKQRVGEQEKQLGALQANWAVRLARSVVRLLRETK
jgi:hypothetical protein